MVARMLRASSRGAPGVAFSSAFSALYLPRGAVPAVSQENTGGLATARGSAASRLVVGQRQSEARDAQSHRM
jgi:hypothetical protein